MKADGTNPNKLSEIRDYLLNGDRSLAAAQEFKEFWTSLTEDEKLDYKLSELK